ncbi:MAG: hypothetical protein A2579_09870 [Lysobacterales bacterium RIFOXYD1_FULL_69_11]|nr:MAG: hypothetical protein A2190_05710 [Xanthomonadales bacterium RIFOXYA1_FULL_69_10]OHE88168.1 MAG: hypothetical protein A2579_09870 [Xanthomonadales bacterium RIFOXYD1_FULL_69_11]
MRADDEVARTTRAQPWQRVVAGVMAAAGGWGLLQAFSSDAIDSWVDAGLALGGTYGLYLFARFALTGALPAGMHGRTPD